MKTNSKLIIFLTASNTDAAEAKSGVPIKEMKEWLENFLVNRPYAPEQFCRTYENFKDTKNVCPEEYCQLELGKCTKKYSCDVDDGKKGLTDDQKFYCAKANEIKNSKEIEKLPERFQSNIRKEHSRIKAHQISAEKKYTDKAEFWARAKDEKQLETIILNAEELNSVQLRKTEQKNKEKPQEKKKPKQAFQLRTTEPKKKEKQQEKIAGLELSKEQKIALFDSFRSPTQSLKENAAPHSKMSREDVKLILSNFQGKKEDIKTLKDAKDFVERYESNVSNLEDEEKKAFQYMRRQAGEIHEENKKKRIENEMYATSVDRRVWTDELKHFCRSLYLQEADEKLDDFEFEKNEEEKITGIKLKAGKSFCKDPFNNRHQKRCESHYTNKKECDDAIKWQTLQGAGNTKACTFDTTCKTSKASNIKGFKSVGLMIGGNQEDWKNYWKFIDSLEDERLLREKKERLRELGQKETTLKQSTVKEHIQF